MVLPVHTDEYLAARKPLLDKWDEARKPYWDRYAAGEITHDEYCDLIEPSLDQYWNEVDPHWIKAGGAKDKRAKYKRPRSALPKR